ncbi:MAG: S41 family peptidase [Bacteroidales bacterium]|nr:S41 family peptidase [Bacteroidales bacterium]
MKRQMKRMAAVLVLLLGAATAPVMAQSRDFKLGQSLEVEYSVLKEIAQSYVDTVNFDKMIIAGVRAMLATLDPYTVYISEEEGDDFELLTTGNYGGVGAIIRKAPGEGVRIIEPYENSPAAKYGLLPGDTIIEIDGKPVYDETSEQSSGRMKGQPGTEVKFKVVKGRTKDTVDVVVVRERIHVSDIAYAGIYRDDIGYIQLSGFTAKVSEEFKENVLKLKEAGAKRLVIDLRDNGGGVMDEAIEIVSLFVPKGTLVVSSKGRVAEMNREYRTTSAPVDTAMPLLVMVNGNSASASEITAGALQDLGRATIAGTRSFGKGLIQSIRPMPYNSQMKVTTGKYYTPSGRCVQAIDYSNRHEDGSLDKDVNGGIAPDIEVAGHPFSRPTVSLVYYDIIGSYAIEYFIAHENIDRDFHLTDAEYEDFVKYAATQDFDARTAAQTALDQLIKAAKSEDLYDNYKDEIEALQKKVNMDKEAVLRAKKAEILPLVEQEIVTRYYFNRAAVPVALRYDAQLREAVDKWLQQ